MFLPTDVPSPTTITNTTETSGCNVNVTWNRPSDNECPLIMYSVYYHQLQPQSTKAAWYQVNVTDVVKTHYVLSLTCDTYYVIEMTAWNQLGQSGRSKPWTIKTGRPPRLPLQGNKIRRRIQYAGFSIVSIILGGKVLTMEREQS